MGYFNYLQKKESGETLPKNTFYGAQPPGHQHGRNLARLTLIALFQKALKNANDEILEDRMPNHSKVHTAAQHTHHTHHIKI
jgi:hypothetical protein